MIRGGAATQNERKKSQGGKRLLRLIQKGVHKVNRLLKSKWFVFSVLVVASFVLFVGACGEDSTTGGDTASSETTATTGSGGASDAGAAADVGPKKIGFVTICAVCTGEARAVSGLQEACDEAGWELLVTDGAGDFQKIISSIETYINEGCDAIVTGAIDPAPLGKVIKQCNDKGIPFIAESGLWVPGVDLQVGMDSYHMGQIQGSYIVDRLEGEGDVMMITYRPTRNVAMREDIVKQILSDYEDIEITYRHEVDINNIIEDSRKAVETQLLRNPDLDAIWCGWDDMCTGAAAAVAAAGRDDIFMIGNDAGEEALNAIRNPDSPWDITVSVDYETIGKTIISELNKIFAGEKLDYKNVFVELPMISRNNGRLPAEGESLPSVDTYTPETAK